MSSEPQNHDLRHDVARRRAVARHRAVAGREGGDRDAARAARSRRGRGRVRGLLAGRLRRRQAVAAAVERPTIASLARTRKEDIDAAAEALADARRSRIHVFIATSPIHMERKLRSSPRRSSRPAGPSATRAASPTRSSSPARTPRAPSPSSPRASAQARPSGPARRRSTSRHGRLLPARGVRAVPPRRRSRCPSSSRTLSVHCHDDLGLAVANTLAGIEAGATQVEATINGLGERAGNAALEVVMALRVRQATFAAETGVNVGEIGRTSRLVEELHRLPRPAQQGDRRRERVRPRGRHPPGRDAQGRETYQIMDPTELGLVMSLPLGKHSGRRAGLQRGRDRARARRPERGVRAFQATCRYTQARDPRDVFEEVSVR